MIASKSDTSSCGIVARFQCLYTKQKSKKRKAWSDGRLDLHANGNCTLYDGYEHGKIKAGNALDTIFLTKDEMNTIVAGNETELELENHLVTVESSAEASENIPPPQLKYAKRSDGAQTSAHLVQHSTEGPGLHASHAVTMHSRTTPAPAPSAEPEPAIRGGSVNTINQGFRPPAVVKCSAILSKPELVKPFKPPAPRTVGRVDKHSSVAEVMTALASRVSAENIQSRYRDCLSGQKPQADDASVLPRGASFASTTSSSGSYSVSKEEIDDMWASESGGFHGEDDKIATEEGPPPLECKELSPAKERELSATNETDVSADNIWGSPSPHASPHAASHLEETHSLPTAVSVAVEDDIWG